jgi:hypothetical protein
MIKIEVRGMKEVRESLARIPRELEGKVIQPALNKVADKARAEITRLVPQEFAVKAAEVRSAVDVRRARSGSMQAVVDVFGSARRRGRSMNLIHFLAAIQAAGRALKARGAKANKAELKALQQQLGFLIKRAGGLKKVEGAFIGNKGRTVFMRTGDARLPIKPVQVIGFSQMFNSRKINGRVMDKIRAELPVEIERALKMVLARV